MFPFFIEGKDGNPHVILIMDLIGDTWWEDGITGKEIVQALSTVDENDEVLVRINSRGGFTDEGTVIYNALADRPGKVICRVEGYASSMATVVMCAGDETHAYETALCMFHKSASGLMGNADDFRAAAEMLDKVDSALFTAYGRKMGVTAEEAQEKLITSHDKWFTADELEDLGIIDQTIQPQKFAVVMDKNASAVLAAGEGACAFDPETEKMPSALLPHIDGMEGVMAVRVGPASVDVTKAMAVADGSEDDPVDEPVDDPEASEDPNDDPVDDPEGSEDPDDDQDDDPEGDEEPEDDPVTAERKRVADIMAMLHKNGLDINGALAQRLLSEDIKASEAGKQIHAFKAELSTHTPSAQGGSVTETEQIQASWEKAYKK